MRHRIVVFTADLSYAVRAGIVEIDRAIGDASWLVVVHAPRKTVLTLARSQLRNLRRDGWRWIPYQLRDAFERVTARRSSTPLHEAPGSEYSAKAFTARANVRIERVNDIHAESTLAAVRTFQPDLGLALASPILRQPLFSIPKRGTLNLHKGKVPQYRGMPPAFWELWNDEQDVGCTVHRVDAKLDTGDIVCSAVIDREQYSDVRGLQLRLETLGFELMRRAVVATLAGEDRLVSQTSGGATFRKPTLRQVALLECRIARRSPAGAPFPKRMLKDAAYAIALGAWRGGALALARPRITVLLYHRVSDDARDNLTVGIAQFDRQMELLRRHCQVISLEQMLAQERPEASDRPVVCVTFDDGYLDNYANAAPILLRHGAPATFFVSTGIVGTDRPFPHDVRRGAARPPTMSWDQVQRMHDQGFAIGSHSVSHIDCAAAPESIVREELGESLAELQRRLGLADVYFAYPFGGRQHMTQQRLALVKEAGYAACLSAYGGSNVGAIDRYNVLRGGINWQFSDRSFRFRCLGIS